LIRRLYYFHKDHEAAKKPNTNLYIKILQCERELAEITEEVDAATMQVQHAERKFKEI
jgi:hypothetical protein